jgi:uncharacterized protein YbcI
MAPPAIPLEGAELLASVTDALVALHQRYHQRAPVAAKAQLMGGDLLVCVLGGVYTDVEQTLIELGRAPIVHENRSAFQTATQTRYVDVVERLSGRDVLQFISTHHVGPDLEVELFLLGPRSSATGPSAQGEA